MLFLLADTSGQASQIIQDGANAGAAVAQSFDQMWTDVISSGGGLYGAIAKLGAFFAVSTVMLWVVVSAKAVVEGNMAQPFQEIIWPLIVVTLLGNNGQLLAQCTLEIRGIINQTNQSVLQSTSKSVQLQDAYKQIMQQTGKQDVAQGLVAQCTSIADPEEQKNCLDNAKLQAQQVGDSNGFQQFLDGAVNFPGTIFSTAVRGWLIAFGIAFQWIVEVSLILTGLMGPLAVGGSLLPLGNKAIFAWLTGFFSVGMVKLSFNIINGLVATMVLNAGNGDPMIFAFATGLLAPVLSLVLAAGGGMAVFSSLSNVATFGFGRVLPFGFR